VKELDLSASNCDFPYFFYLIVPYIIALKYEFLRHYQIKHSFVKSDTLQGITVCRLSYLGEKLLLTVSMLSIEGIFIIAMKIGIVILAHAHLEFYGELVNQLS
jgi:hypothetical protein